MIKRFRSSARVELTYELMALDLSFCELHFTVFTFYRIERLVSVKILFGSCQRSCMRRVLVSHEMPQVLADKVALILITWVLIPDDRLLEVQNFGIEEFIGSMTFSILRYDRVLGDFR